MAEYTVTIPIAGHAFVDVEADNEKDAIDKAFGQVTRDNIHEWEALEMINQGNVCFAPMPWEIQVEEVT